MKIKFIFGKGDIDVFSTNILFSDEAEIEKELLNPDNNIITYTFNDLPLTKKFIKMYKEYLKEHTDAVPDKIAYGFNYYVPTTYDSFTQAKIGMNDTIAKLQSYGYEIPDNLLLDTSSPLVNASELDKLNQLHFWFETSTILITPETPNAEHLWYLWEKINNVVHFLERDLNSEYFTVVTRRLVNYNINYLKLEDEDYSDFTHTTGGDLVADFSTVGKDVSACFTSNDIDLIKNGEVKQQEYLTDWFTLPFTNTELTDEGRQISTDTFNKWIADNNIGDYIDLKLKKYYPGRHVLGTIDKMYTSDEFYNEVFKKTPKFLGYVVCDDEGNVIK